ncbi:MAG: deaminase [bacterium]
MSQKKQRIAFAYVPVLHEGYRRFFVEAKADTLYLMGPELCADFPYLAKEIRALAPELIKKAIESLNIFAEVRVASADDLEKINTEEYVVVTPKEDVGMEIAKKHLPRTVVEFSSIFLRWDKHKAMEERPVQADQTISRGEFEKGLMKALFVEAEKSSDWWRRIGSAIVKDGKIVLQKHNEHLPSAHSPYADGDPRNAFHKGVGVEISTSIHSEAGLVAEAARQGISLEGADMFATVFPCPPCAKQIAFSGIKRLFYAGGYTVLDQESILKSRGVEIIFVEMEK